MKRRDEIKLIGRSMITSSWGRREKGVPESFVSPTSPRAACPLLFHHPVEIGCEDDDETHEEEGEDEEDETVWKIRRATAGISSSKSNIENI